MGTNTSGYWWATLPSSSTTRLNSPSATMDLQERTPAVDTEGDSESDGLWEEASDYEDEEDSVFEYIIDEEYPTPPEVTLTSLTEIGQEESTIPVLKQRSYTGEEVISSVLADTLCADLGADGVLKEFNTALGTSYSLDSVISILEPYVAQNVDFGTAYAYLRRNLHLIYLSGLTLRGLEEYDEERRNVLADGRITRRSVPPRRVWDLRANRVVPYWVAGCDPWAISHAWMDEKDRADVMTPINGYEWPVPMPKDADLDLIRIEMLNMRPRQDPHLRAEYVWLDVLCLRQEGGKNEHLRLDEWKLDVPTIGAVYEHAYKRVVYYLSGLGRPLHLTPDYFESDRCWFRRAWTLQEITENPIIAGVTGKDVTDTQVQTRFDKELKSLQWMSAFNPILDYVSEMRNRVSTKSLDKVAGLVYLLNPYVIPIYDAKQSPEEAWEVLMDVMGRQYKLELLFLYPEPGDGKKRWRPSWEQVTSNRLVVPLLILVCDIKRTEDPDIDCYIGSCIKSANVRGLGEVPNEPTPRQGEVDFNDNNGAPHTLKIVAGHIQPIPDGIYTLLGCYSLGNPDRWVLGHIRKDGRFEKLSVFCSVHDEVRFDSLELDREVKTFLS
ncbi:hypothetical protein EDD18DRAFT_1281505 [Armillaria luteobubalina]|uniref:Heterokaryon incompatibility domain-containing protein n=1 Tax=Armillaria luteobubalina TaxID=153913 RepID=A0AA39QCD8_9AGAR|nr:hypothetical protein EDD18DRAFT_1281505 [Armillaria luteobubalina]